ncbi:MAG TPA: CHASE4 domain-containing protein, partial [bacterium]|nr:CHASE4 domain-containing protein [bacterium]
MKLQSKIIATVIGVYVITILSLYLFSINNYVRTLEQLEKDMMQKNLERVDKTLKKEQLGLNRVAKDWACWDETYNFVCHPNREFIERNLKIDDFVNLKINFLVIADDKNRIIVAKYFDMQHKKFVEKERLL